MRRCSLEDHVRTTYKSGKSDCLSCRRSRAEKERLLPGYRDRRREQYQSAKNKPGYRERQAKRVRRMKYGIDCIPEGEVCALCPKLANTIDHDHATGKVRGFLCRICNVWVAVIENRVWVNKADSYLNGLIREVAQCID